MRRIDGVAEFCLPLFWILNFVLFLYLLVSFVEFGIVCFGVDWGVRGRRSAITKQEVYAQQYSPQANYTAYNYVWLGCSWNGGCRDGWVHGWMGVWINGLTDT